MAPARSPSAGANDYTGTTVVNEGKLDQYHRRFTVARPSRSPTAPASACNCPWFGQFNLSSVTLGTSAGTTLTSTSAALAIRLIPPAHRPGNLALNGTVTVNIADTLPQIGRFR